MSVCASSTRSTSAGPWWAYGDIGGFSAGSDFTWQVALGAAYDFSKTISGKFGYRYLSVDYDKGGFLYDMKTQGVYLGLGIRF
jgi:opacity protein-like surface antigen